MDVSHQFFCQLRLNASKHRENIEDVMAKYQDCEDDTQEIDFNHYDDGSDEEYDEETDSSDDLIIIDDDQEDSEFTEKHNAIVQGLCQSFITSTPTFDLSLNKFKAQNLDEPSSNSSLQNSPEPRRVPSISSPLLIKNKKQTNILNSVRERNLINRLKAEEESVLVYKSSSKANQKNGEIKTPSKQFDLMAICQKQMTPKIIPRKSVSFYSDKENSAVKTNRNRQMNNGSYVNENEYLNNRILDTVKNDPRKDLEIKPRKSVSFCQVIDNIIPDTSHHDQIHDEIDVHEKKILYKNKIENESERIDGDILDHASPEIESLILKEGVASLLTTNIVEEDVLEQSKIKKEYLPVNLETIGSSQIVLSHKGAKHENLVSDRGNKNLSKDVPAQIPYEIINNIKEEFSQEKASVHCESAEKFSVKTIEADIISLKINQVMVEHKSDSNKEVDTSNLKIRIETETENKKIFSNESNGKNDQSANLDDYVSDDKDDHVALPDVVKSNTKDVFIETDFDSSNLESLVVEKINRISLLKNELEARRLRSAQKDKEKLEKFRQNEVMKEHNNLESLIEYKSSRISFLQNQLRTQKSKLAKEKARKSFRESLRNMILNESEDVFSSENESQESNSEEKYEYESDRDSNYKECYEVTMENKKSEPIKKYDDIYSPESNSDFCQYKKNEDANDKLYSRSKVAIQNNIFAKLFKEDSLNKKSVRIEDQDKSSSKISKSFTELTRRNFKEDNKKKIISKEKRNKRMNTINFTDITINEHNEPMKTKQNEKNYGKRNIQSNSKFKDKLASEDESFTYTDVEKNNKNSNNTEIEFNLFRRAKSNKKESDIYSDENDSYDEKINRSETLIKKTDWTEEKSKNLIDTSGSHILMDLKEKCHNSSDQVKSESCLKNLKRPKNHVKLHESSKSSEDDESMMYHEQEKMRYKKKTEGVLENIINKQRISSPLSNIDSKKVTREPSDSNSEADVVNKYRKPKKEPIIVKIKSKKNDRDNSVMNNTIQFYNTTFLSMSSLQMSRNESPNASRRRVSTNSSRSNTNFQNLLLNMSSKR